VDQTLNGRYELQERLGSGGMGDVWRAHDTRLDRTVAIKFLRHGPLSDDVSRARMRSEALLAASIHHPGVAQVYDYEEDGESGDGSAYIVMQHVEGHSVAELLRATGPMPAAQVMSIVVQVASGLQAAHDAGVVHRDVKPANIMVTPAGRAVLVDFGLARAETSEPLTDTGTVLGTAQYSSPEQSSGRPATPRSDLYSLGIVAHHCLTGKSPFRRDTPMATALAHLNDDPPPLGDEVPPAVRDLVTTMTAKNPSQRPDSAATVAETASAIGADRDVDLPDTLGTAVAADANESQTSSTAGTSESAAGPGRSRARRGALVALVATIALVLAATSWWPGGSTQVPDVVGMSADGASAALRDAGLTPRTSAVDVPGGKRGDVVEQDPPAGDPAPDDGVVRLSIVSGLVVVRSEDVLGLPYAEAATALEDLGLVVERTDVERDVDPGTVVTLDRSGRLESGSTVVLGVAVAPAPLPQTSTQGTSSASSGSSSSGSSSSGSSNESSSSSNGKAKGKDKGKGKKNK
jgi:serine/threonine-protein kinase